MVASSWSFFIMSKYIPMSALSGWTAKVRPSSGRAASVHFPSSSFSMAIREKFSGTLSMGNCEVHACMVFSEGFSTGSIFTPLSAFFIIPTVRLTSARMALPNSGFSFSCAMTDGRCSMVSGWSLAGSPISSILWDATKSLTNSSRCCIEASGWRPPSTATPLRPRR